LSHTVLPDYFVRVNDDIRQLGTGLGQRMIARDWAGVHALLAPWLQATLSPDDVRAFFQDQYRDVLEDNGVEGTHHPEKIHIGGNAEMTAKELHSPVSSWSEHVRPVPLEVTDENLRYWMRLVLECSDEQADELEFDDLADVWLAVVETGEGLRVGFGWRGRINTGHFCAQQTSPQHN
jgi:hypothetical protein